MVVPNFVRQALANEPITVFGDGTQSRGFTHVSDVVGALIKLIGSRRRSAGHQHRQHPGSRHRANWPNASATLAGSTSQIKHIPYDEAYESGFEDMPRRVPDLTKIKSLIGYEPKHDLDYILAQVVEYFREK